MKLLEKAVLIIEAYKKLATKYNLTVCVSRDNTCIFIDMQLYKGKGETVIEMEFIKDIYQMATEINNYTVFGLSFFEQKEKETKELSMLSGTRWYGVHSILKYYEYPEELINFRAIDQTLSNIPGIQHKIS